jgi:hypothetical protein
MNLERNQMVLALWQHYIDTYMGEHGDLDLRFVQPYSPTMVEAIVTKIVKEDGVRVTLLYLGEGGYTDAYKLAERVIDRYFPEGLHDKR